MLFWVEVVDRGGQCGHRAFGIVFAMGIAGSTGHGQQASKTGSSVVGLSVSVCRCTPWEWVSFGGGEDGLDADGCIE